MESIGKQHVAWPCEPRPKMFAWFKLWNLSDIHLGNAACALSQCRKDIDRINEDPYSFWFGGGDYAEYIGFNDKRFDPDCVDENIRIKDMGHIGKVLNDQVKELFMPIKHKCLGLIFGNHERKYEVRTEQTRMHADLCEALGVKNLGYGAFVDVVFVRKKGGEPELLGDTVPRVSPTQRKTFRVCIHHGAGFAQTRGGKFNRMSRMMNIFDADIYMMGHVHDQQGQRKVRMCADPDCGKIMSRESIGVISGSCLKTYEQGVTTYGEQRMYEPTPLGASMVQVQPQTGEFRGEI